MNNKKEFLLYVEQFYGVNGIYPMNATPEQIKKATKILLSKNNDVEFDSIDREKVRDILISEFNLVFPQP